jgi:hypothetical protein
MFTGKEPIKYKSIEATKISRVTRGFPLTGHMQIRESGFIELG